jgi:hypothetical protein
MNNNFPVRIGAVLVTIAALSAVVVSQLTSQRASLGGAPTVSVASLLGDRDLRPADPRFRPMALAVVNEAVEGTMGAAAKGSTFVKETVWRDYFQQHFVNIPAGAARGTTMRQLTPSEALFLQELFSSDLRKAGNVRITREGVQGSVLASELGTKPEDLMQRAKAAASRKSQWFHSAASSAGASGQ